MQVIRVYKIIEKQNYRKYLKSQNHKKYLKMQLFEIIIPHNKII